MKNFLTILTLIAFWQINEVRAQDCAYNASHPLAGDATPAACDGITTGIVSVTNGEYATVSVVNGNVYTFSTCTASWDTQIDLWDVGGTTSLAANDDGCALQSTVTWIATYTGTVEAHVFEWDCVSDMTAPAADLLVTCSAAPSGPPNDECMAAIPVAINPDLSCTLTTPGTINGATGSGENDATCSGTENDDVWFSFMATSTAHTISLLNLVNGTTDLYHSVWSGSCGSLTNILCSDPNTSTASGLTIGNTYYLKVNSWTSSSGQTTEFDVCISTPPPPPANNDCSGAIDYNTAFSPVGATGSCPGNTHTLDISDYTDAGTDPTCDTGGDAAAWYTWTANYSAISFTSGTGGPGLEILDGTCGSFTSLGCLNNTSGTITGLSIGTTYYMIIWDDGLTGTNLEFCIEAAPAPPVNDDCTGAIDFDTAFSPVGANGSCPGNTHTLDISNYNDAGEDPSCEFGSDAVAWYTWTANYSAISFTSGTGGPGLEILDGSCGSFTSLGCLNNTSGTISGMTVGNPYYMIIYDEGLSGTNLEFCIEEAPGAPGNDECAMATMVVVNPDESCTLTTPGTIAGATGSGQNDATCGGTENDDVWFSFTATSTAHTISLLNIVNGTTDLYHSVWSGACGSLVNILCSDPNTSTASGLTIGNTYYLKVNSWTSTSGQTSDFDVCIGTPPAPPANDDCSGAIDYTSEFGAVGANGSCPGNTQTIDISNYSDAGTDPTCDFGGDAAAWYTWTATATGVNFTSGTGAPGLEILDGTCGSFTSLGCLNNTSGSISGMTIGNTYYFIIWDDGTAGTTLTFCIEEAAAPPSNNACTGATAVSVGAATAMGSTVNATNVESLTACSGGGGGQPGCAAGTGSIDFGAGVWFSYTSTGAEILTANTEGSNFDTEIQVFEGSCGSLTCIGGDDDSGIGSTSSFCWVSTASFAPVTYYIYIDGHAANSGDYVLNLLSAVLPVELNYFTGSKMPRSNMLKWETGSEINVSHFSVERSANGMDWDQIGMVEANGFSSTAKQYTYEDKLPLSNAYYRLRSVDFDGYEEYSDVVQINRNDRNIAFIEYLAPNPVSETLFVSIHTGSADNGQYYVVNNLGQVVDQNTFNTNETTYRLELNTIDFDPGVYFISIEVAGEVLHKSFVKY